MIKIITPEETYPVRRKVLRKNMPNEPHEFHGDFDEQTFHLGYLLNNEIVGILTIIKNGKIAQLRGMAVLEEHQGKNIGRKLVEKVEEILAKERFSKIWMNARESAVPFYQKLGYTIEGEIFIIEPIGFHYVMTKYFD